MDWGTVIQLVLGVVGAAMLAGGLVLAFRSKVPVTRAIGAASAAGGLVLLAFVVFTVPVSRGTDVLADGSPTPVITVDLHPVIGEPFQLPINGSAFLDAQGYRMTFIRVVQDSRCPINVQCVTAGFAVVEVSIRTDTSASEQLFQMRIGDFGPGEKTVRAGAFQIEFMNLTPLPGATGSVSATFVAQPAI